LQKALRMPLRERKRRHKALMQRLRKRDVHAWYSSFLDVLLAVPSQDR
jgi:trehalose 6-phosphate synthase